MSGLPFTVSSGSNLNFDSLGHSRPNFTGVHPKLGPHRCRVCGATGQSPTSVTTQWFNSTYVAADKTNMAAAQAAGMSYILNGPGVTGGIGPGGADGNVRRGSIIGPGLKDMDAALLRDVKFERGSGLPVPRRSHQRYELGQPRQPSTGNITNSSQGTITGNAGTQRIIQLGGRLTF